MHDTNTNQTLSPDILFFGDLHGRFDHVIDLVNARRPAAIILLGDIQAQRPLEVELASILDKTLIRYIHGNHDTDSLAEYEHLFASKVHQWNLHGKVETLAGVRVAGLGGVFRGQIWRPPAEAQHLSPEAFCRTCGQGNLWEGGLPRKHRSSIFPSDIQSLSKLTADILVSHEAPSCHPNGFEAIDELARSLGVSVAVHGHQHEDVCYQDWEMVAGFNAFGVGMRGAMTLSGEFVLAGERG